jgi:hypothetical protein
MRVALIVVMTMAVTTPSIASQSCMSQAEARKHFVSAHLYWHGPSHCWDATAPRHRQIQAREKNPVRQVQRNEARLKWQDSQDSISATVPDDGPGRSLTMPKLAEGDAAVTDTSWIERWVELRPSQSPLVARPVRVLQLSPEPVVEPKSVLSIPPQTIVLLTFLTFTLALGTITVLSRQDS